MNPLFIAILGFGVSCPKVNAETAYEIGREIALDGNIVCCGNFTGTFFFAFKGAKSVKGRTIAILERDKVSQERSFCDEIIIVENTEEKHKLISEKCIGAIVIGGAQGTGKLINRFLEKGKRVVAVKHSGGIVKPDMTNTIDIVDCKSAYRKLKVTQQLHPRGRS